MAEKEVRLIDANALDSLLDDVEKGYRKRFLFKSASELKWIREAVSALRTIDPESLRAHGKWLETVEELGWQEVRCFECSVCGESWILDEEWSIEEIKACHHYCPNCGAKMEV